MSEAMGSPFPTSAAAADQAVDAGQATDADQAADTAYAAGRGVAPADDVPADDVSTDDVAARESAVSVAPARDASGDAPAEASDGRDVRGVSDAGASAAKTGVSAPLEAPGLSEQAPSIEDLPTSIKAAVRDLEQELIGGERSMKRREVAADVGVSLLSARKIWRALGFPNLGDDDTFFTEADEVGLRTIVDLVRDEKVTEEAAISLARSVGQMTDRIVVWQVEAMIEELVSQQGMSDAQAREQLVRVMPTLIEPLQSMLVYAWRRQMAAGVQRMAVRALPEVEERGAATASEPNALPLARAVGFADLVSYTSLSRRMSEKTLARLVQRFENRCAEIISTGGGRLIKTVGDEVLYTAETPAAGAEIALSMAEAMAEDEILPQTRGAMVWGRLLSRLGDIYGPTVNLSARLTALAEPGTVLVDEFTANTLRPDQRYVVTALPVQDIRGFGEISAYQLSRGAGPGMILD